MRRFNDLADFSRDEIKELIALAARLDAKPEPRALEGKVLSLLFLSPSLRTLSSFQAAMIRLGGGAFVISPDMSIHGLESRYGIVMDGTAAEHVREAIPVIASYGDAIGLRAFAERRVALDLAERDLQLPITAELRVAGKVVGCGNVCAGQVGEPHRGILPRCASAEVATVDQDVGIGGKPTADLRQLLSVAVAHRFAVEHARP